MPTIRFLDICKTSLVDMYKHRRLATALAIRDTKAKYRGSLLGLFWAIFPPIAAAIGLAAAKGAGVLNLGETPIPYPAYVVLSMSLWQLFATAVSRPIAGLQAARSVLTKVDFPREVIILSELHKLLITAVIQAILVAGVFVYFGIPVGPSAVLAIFPIAVLILLGIMVSVFLAPVALLYGDIGNAMPMALGALFFVTPVVYPPPPRGGTFSFVVQMNPVTPLIETTRELLYSPAPVHFGGFVLVSLLLVPFGMLALVLFRVAMPVVVERWSS